MIEDFYISCTRQRPSMTLDSDTNRPNVTFTNTSINGYLQGSQTDVKQMKAGKYSTLIQKKFYCDDWDLQRGDFIIYDNLRYEVIGVPKDTANRYNHIYALVELSTGVKQNS